MKLNKCLYGLKQSPRYWNADISNYFTSLGFKELQAESCVFFRIINQIFTILILYVDDITIACSDNIILQNLKQQFQQKYKMKDMGHIQQFLGMKIKYDQQQGTVKFSQQLYIKNILDEYLVEKQIKKSYPMKQSYDNTWDHLDNSELLQKDNNYREVIGKLIHLCNLTRPDISFAVSVLCSKTSNPTKRDEEAVQNLLQYLNKTDDFSLNVGGTLQEPTGYVDASYARRFANN